MENCCATLLEDVRRERSLILLLIFNGSRCDKTNRIDGSWKECNKKIKSLALEKPHRQKTFQKTSSCTIIRLSISVWRIFWANISFNADPKLLKIKTEDDDIKKVKSRTEKHDYENIWNLLKLIMIFTKTNIKFKRKESTFGYFLIFIRNKFNNGIFYKIYCQSIFSCSPC